MAIGGTAVEPLWAACCTWLRRAEEVVRESAEALNALNVFPVADADTGSNLTLTLQGINRASSEDRMDLDAALSAAILSAHGNSGAIVAEMLTSVGRDLASKPVGDVSQSPDATVAAQLRRASSAAARAVAHPVAGTILTVADRAASAAEEAVLADGGSALAVAVAAQKGAREALQQTTGQLDELARAGVVDAGGAAFVLLLDVLVEVLGGAPAQPLSASPASLPPRTAGQGRLPSRLEYEVMFAVQGASRTALDALRGELSELGHSVVIVGDDVVAQVHAHLQEPGAAVEAGLGAGRLSQVRITALEPVRATQQRLVLAVVAGEGLASAVRELGGLPVQGAGGRLVLSELSAALASSHGDAVILPNDMANLELAHHLVEQHRDEGRHIAVIPTVAQVQGLAALAVHEPTADLESAVVAMSTAAAHTRQGAVTIAESAAMTMAGRCRPGEVLGVVEGDFVEIGTSVVDVAWRVLSRLLAAGGELVTLVAGVEAAPDLVSELERRVRRADDTLDVETLDGGQSRYPVLIGVE